MSIYATMWVVKVEILTNKGRDFVEVWAQGVPPHIGYDDDYYKDFLPPPVKNYDQDSDEDYPYRAVLIVQEGRMEKEGQKYIDPILMLSGEEYRKIPFPELLGRILEGVKDVKN